MTERRTDDELGGLLEELDEVAGRAREVFGRLSGAQLNWKPSAEQWSVGQCLEHLIRTNRGFFPVLEGVARGTRRQTLWERVSPLSGLFGKLLLRTLASERKFRAARRLDPSASEVGAGVVAEFARQQEELAGAVRAASGADLRRIIITSPVSRFVTYNMLDACRIVVAHNRRHLRQARRVTEVPGFPRAEAEAAAS